jgi:uncharacterized membrane protein
MESRAKLFGHPILIPFPLGLLPTSVLFDVVYLLTGNGKWAVISFWMIAVGLAGGVAATVFGAIDLERVPDGTRAKAVGIVHAVSAGGLMALFASSWLLRLGAPGGPGAIAIILSLLGIGLAVLTGWLGGELIARLGVGVSRGAHLNSPSSLSGRPASEGEGSTDEQRRG